jgi:hypothetical protein
VVGRIGEGPPPGAGRWGREEVKKKNTSGREDVHPQNGLNGLILNWCIGGCFLVNNAS